MHVCGYKSKDHHRRERSFIKYAGLRKAQGNYLSIYISTFMYYNIVIAASTMVVKLQLKENIKHAIECTITHLKRAKKQI